MDPPSLPSPRPPGREQAIRVARLALHGAALLLASCSQPAPRPALRSVPIEAIAHGRPAPQIGLTGPFPEWAPLPPRGRVIGAELFAPQPPYGAAAVAMVVIDDSFEDFAAAYRVQLAARGFEMRASPMPFNLGVDRPHAVYEADEIKGGHVVYVTLRSGGDVRVAQLTFWSPPAPRGG
jgi:hypothetical protein